MKDIRAKHTCLISDTKRSVSNRKNRTARFWSYQLTSFGLRIPRDELQIENTMVSGIAWPTETEQISNILQNKRGLRGRASKDSHGWENGLSPQQDAS